MEQVLGGCGTLFSSGESVCKAGLILQQIVTANNLFGVGCFQGCVLPERQKYDQGVTPVYYSVCTTCVFSLNPIPLSITLLPETVRILQITCAITTSE